MRRFQLLRLEDESGVSGTGIIAEGVQSTVGICILFWLTKYASIGIYESMESLMAIHGHAGKTLLEWLD